MKDIGEMDGKGWAFVVGETSFDLGGGVFLHLPRPRGSDTVGPLERAYQERQRAIGRMEDIRRCAERFTGEVVAVYGDEEDGQIDLHYADGRVVHLRSTGYDGTGINVREEPR